MAKTDARSAAPEAVTPARRQLLSLLAPGTGCGPISATVRLARQDGWLAIWAEVEHPIAALPLPDAPLVSSAVDVAIRVEGPVSRGFNIAFYAKLDKARPELRFWGAPQAELDPESYTSSQRVIDATHYAFEARVPLSLLGATEEKLGCRVSLAGYRGGCMLVRLATAGEAPRLPGWEGKDGYALLEGEVTFKLGSLDQLIAPRTSACLKTDEELGLGALPDARHILPVTVGSDRLPLDGDWRFSGTGAKPDETAEAWRTWPIIRLPGHHALQDLLIEEPAGVGRWKREIAVPESFAGRRVLLRLDSVEGQAQVQVNGRLVATIDSPYLPSEVDVTSALQPGRANVIEITASRRGHLSAASGRSTTSLFPDITGRVWLEALPASWLENMVCKTDAAGSMSLTWQVAGEGDECRIVGRLFDATMTQAWEASIPATRGALAGQVANVHAWHPETPYLYTLELELWRDSTRVAMYRQRVGFRSVRVGRQQLLLNGKPITVLGTCHHPQQPHTGWWLREDEHRRDAELFRRANVNCIRVWPMSEAFLDACDELGVMVQMEVPVSFFNYSGNEFNPEDNSHRKRSPAVRDAMVERTLRFLLQYRNRACVCLWSVGNESDWDDGFEASARTIKRLDPSRPVLASQDGGRGLGLPALDIDSDHYPLNRYHAFTPATGDRPILHTEWCHISCRNVGELTTDPGIHDRHVDALRRVVGHARNNTIGCIGGHIFTGMDAIAFAYPAGYPAEKDHVACLGFVDRWRRPTPEYHHVWKVYAPIEVSDAAPTQRDGVLVLGQVENRSAASGIHDFRFTWRSGGRGGDAVVRDPKELHIACPPGDDLEVSCWNGAGQLVNRWMYPAAAPSQPAYPRLAPTARKTGDGVTVQHGASRWTFAGGALPVVHRGDGKRILWDAGRLVVTPGASNPPPGLATEWTCGRVDIADGREGKVVVTLRGRYAEAEGGYEYRFDPDGRVTIGYRFAWRGGRIRVRELGVACCLPRDCDHLQWRRDAEWSWYPADHIGRPIGDTAPFPDPRAMKAGPWDLPTWPWAHDATPAGCKDYRSTKRHIRSFSLTDPSGAGLTLVADGNCHARAWVAEDHVVAQGCHFTGRSAEAFVAGLDPADLFLEAGTEIAGELTVRLGQA